MYDLKPGQLIECDWLDPAAASEWARAKNVTFWEYRCRSIGYVHMVTEVGLTLTACYGVDPDGDKDLLLRQYIPWICITDLWILREQC